MSLSIHGGQNVLERLPGLAQDAVQLSIGQGVLGGGVEQDQGPVCAHVPETELVTDQPHCEGTRPVPELGGEGQLLRQGTVRDELGQIVAGHGIGGGDPVLTDQQSGLWKGVQKIVKFRHKAPFRVDCRAARTLDNDVLLSCVKEAAVMSRARASK